MSPWAKLLLVALPLAVLLTAAFRFVQHTDNEYAFWIATFGETAAALEARCAASGSPGICARAQERRSFADSFRTHRDRVVAWWWPTLIGLLMAWITVAVSGIAMLCESRRRGVARLPPGAGADN